MKECEIDRRIKKGVGKRKLAHEMARAEKKVRREGGRMEHKRKRMEEDKKREENQRREGRQEGQKMVKEAPVSP